MIRTIACGVAVLGCSVAVAQPAEPADGSDQPPANGVQEIQEIAPEQPVEPIQPIVPKPDKPAPQRDHVYTMDELAVPTTFLRFGINFFGDTTLAATTPGSPHTAFGIGTLGVRMLGELSPSLDALAEVAFETTDDGPLADVEQLALRWRKGPGLLELGRVHTNFGYWNTAYHHGLWLQTPIERPHALRFEDDGGLAPVHWVGAHYTIAPGPFAVVLGVGNGRGDIVDDIRVAHDTNEAKSALVKVRYKTETLDAGVGAIYDVIAPADVMIRPALANRRIDEVIGNAYLAYRSEGPLVIAEGYAFRHQTSTESWMTYAVYALAGHTVADNVTVYGAIDIVRGADDDPFFRPDPAMSPLLDIVEGLAGVRLDVSTWSAVKLELRYGHPDQGEDIYTGALNWSFGL